MPAPRSFLSRGPPSYIPAALRRPIWRGFYNLIARLSARSDATFACMNWGYADPNADLPGDLGPERYPLQLYLALVGDTRVAGRDVAEISCGRGGGLAMICRRLAPASCVGVDLTPGNIALCEERFGEVEGLTFQLGDAMALPFADASLDVLLSVEASHCYPDEGGFLREVERVLRPGGVLLWTDWRPADEMGALRAAIPPTLEILHERDIAENVVAAMRADAPRRQQIIREAAPWGLKRAITIFAASEDDTPNLLSFVRGERVYFLMRVRRA